LGRKEDEMKKLLFAMFLLMLATAAPDAGADARFCLARSDLVEALVTDYGEQLAEVKKVEGRGLLEFHVSPTDGSWTALITDEDRTSCVIATGEGVDPRKVPLLHTGVSI
jgi:hypothetical protein